MRKISNLMQKKKIIKLIKRIIEAVPKSGCEIINPKGIKTKTIGRIRKK